MCQNPERVTFLIFTTIVILYLGISFNVLYIFELFVENSLHDKYVVLGVFFAITFNLFFLLTLYTYWKTSLTSPGRPILDKRLVEQLKIREYDQNAVINKNVNQINSSSYIDEESKNNNVDSNPLYNQYLLSAPISIARKDNQLMSLDQNNQINQSLNENEQLDDIHTFNPKRCQFCDSFKVVRTHHCRTCGFCIFRRDHHCVWIGSCVGIKNHKFFIQFLIYAAIALFQICIPVLCDFLQIGIQIMDARQNIIQYVILCSSMVISGAFTISLFGLFVFQFYISSHNQTTLELHYNPQHKNIFNRGNKQSNLTEIFGEKFSYRWFIPVTPRFNETYKIYCEDYEIEFV